MKFQSYQDTQCYLELDTYCKQAIHAFLKFLDIHKDNELAFRPDVPNLDIDYNKVNEQTRYMKKAYPDAVEANSES